MVFLERILFIFRTCGSDSAYLRAGASTVAEWYLRFRERLRGKRVFRKRGL